MTRQFLRPFCPLLFSLGGWVMLLGADQKGSHLRFSVNFI